MKNRTSYAARKQTNPREDSSPRRASAPAVALVAPSEGAPDFIAARRELAERTKEVNHRLRRVPTRNPRDLNERSPEEVLFYAAATSDGGLVTELLAAAEDQLGVLLSALVASLECEFDVLDTDQIVSAVDRAKRMVESARAFHEQMGGEGPGV